MAVHNGDRSGTRDRRDHEYSRSSDWWNQLSRIYNLLKEQMMRMETKQKYMTVPAAIRELEKVEMVRRNGKNYKLDHAVTRTQKLILNSFGLDETDIKKSAVEYGKLLNISQSYIGREV